MMESDWLAAGDPDAMLRFLESRHILSRRVFLLFACACFRSMAGLKKGEAESAIREVESVADRLKRSNTAGLQRRFMSALPTTTGSRLFDAWGNADRSLMSFGLLLASRSEVSHFTYLFERAARVAQGGEGELVEWSRRMSNSPSPEEVATAEVQCCILRDLVGNPFRPVTGLCGACFERCKDHHSGEARPEDVPNNNCKRCREIMTTEVVRLARAANSERFAYQPTLWNEWVTHRDPVLPSKLAILADAVLDNARLLVLSDALEEAGCLNHVLLQHLRGKEYTIHPLTRSLVAWTDFDGRSRAGRSRDGRSRNVTSPPRQMLYCTIRQPRFRGLWSLDCLLERICR